MIDEMGYLPLGELEATIFFQLVSARYERGSIILTSNNSYGDWGTIFGDPIIARAILDRLLHHWTTINIRGESYRLKDRRRAGLVAGRDHGQAPGIPGAGPPALPAGPRRLPCEARGAERSLTVRSEWVDFRAVKEAVSLAEVLRAYGG